MIDTDIKIRVALAPPRVEHQSDSSASTNVWLVELTTAVKRGNGSDTHSGSITVSGAQ